MAKIARVVAPGAPHHITQRGNRRQEEYGKIRKGRRWEDEKLRQFILISQLHNFLTSQLPRSSEKPEVYPWSSAAAHMSGRDDVLVKVSPLLEMVKDWREFRG